MFGPECIVPIPDKGPGRQRQVTFYESRVIRPKQANQTNRSEPDGGSV